MFFLLTSVYSPGIGSGVGVGAGVGLGAGVGVKDGAGKVRWGITRTALSEGVNSIISVTVSDRSAYGKIRFMLFSPL
jgi:hypothetical protein